MYYRSCISLVAVAALVAVTAAPVLAAPGRPECPGSAGAFPGRGPAGTGPPSADGCTQGAFPDMGVGERLELCCGQIDAIASTIEAQGLGKRLAKFVSRIAGTCEKAEVALAGDHPRKARRAHAKARALPRKLAALERRLAKVGLGSEEMAGLSEELSRGQGTCLLVETRLADLR